MEREKSAVNDWAGLLKAALDISRKRSAILERMKAALEQGKDAEVVRLGKELFGIQDEHSRN